MATSNQAFVKMTAAQLIGSTVQAAGYLAAVNGSNADQMVTGATATRLDRWLTDFNLTAYALSGACRLSLSGTTPKTITLADLTSATASSAGDTVFAKFMVLICYNDGAADVTIAQGASNPASLGFAGTTPTLTIPAGKAFIFNFATAGVTVDSTHKTIDVTPTAGGSFVLVVGGA